jgi:hypothetical protein
MRLTLNHKIAERRNTPAKRPPGIRAATTAIFLALVLLALLPAAMATKYQSPSIFQSRMVGGDRPETA